MQKSKNYSNGTLYAGLCLTMIIAFLSACSDIQQTPQTPEIQAAEGLIWRNPDSCRLILASINYNSLPLSEQMYWHLLHEHANQKGNLPTSSDSIMPIIINYFTQTNNYRYLGKAYYVQGMEFLLQSRYKDAIRALKVAETNIPYLDTIEPYAGLIYYRLGYVCESEQLYSISLEYYRQAVPYLEACNSHHYLAFCYRDILRTAHSICTHEDSLVTSAYNRAIEEAILSGNLALSKEIQFHYELNKPDKDSTTLFELCTYLCDSFGQNRYAYFKAMRYLNEGNIPQGTEYLHRFASDTANSAWSKIQYRYLQSLFYSKTGCTSLAFSTLQQVYHDLWILLQQDADTRVYTISRHYDLEREQNRSLQLQIEKQRLHSIIVGVVALLLVCVLVALLIITHQRNEKRILQQQAEQHQLKAQAEQLRTEKQRVEAENQRIKAEKQYAEAERKRIEAEKQHIEAQNHIAQLNAELQARREALRKTLHLRIDLTKRLHQLPAQDLQYLSKAFMDSLKSLTFSDKDTWQQFLNEFNDSYVDLLVNVKRNNPKTTDKDLQYIALAKLELSINDICYLLGVSEQTIWNRRQRLKSHIGNPDVDVDDWIRMLGSQA